MSNIIIVSNMYPDKDDSVKGIFVERIREQIHARGIVAEVIAPNNDKNISGLRRYLKFYFEAVKRLHKKNYDLIYVHYASHSAPPVLLCRLFGNYIPIVTHVHGSDVFPEESTGSMLRKVKRFLSTLLINRSAHVVVPSAYFAKKMTNHYLVDSTKLHVSPSGGVDFRFFFPREKIWKREVGAKFVVGFVGRLTEDKGLRDYYQLLRSLKDNDIDVEGLVVGDGPMRTDVLSWVADGTVHYFGSLDSPALGDMYRSLDVFVFPTKREGESLGLVGLEALACGLPVVAYDGTGPSTYIRDGENGHLVQRGGVSDLVDRVIQIYRLSEDEYNEMSASAVKTAYEFSSQKVGDKLSDVLRQSIKQ